MSNLKSSRNPSKYLVSELPSPSVEIQSFMKNVMVQVEEVVVCKLCGRLMKFEVCPSESRNNVVILKVEPCDCKQRYEDYKRRINDVLGQYAER